MGIGAWWAALYGVAQSRTRLKSQQQQQQQEPQRGHNTLISEPGQGVAKGRKLTSPGRWQRNAVASRGGLGRWVSGWAGREGNSGFSGLPWLILSFHRALLPTFGGQRHNFRVGWECWVSLSPL